MSKSNKFGFDPLPDEVPTAKPTRRPGPMGAAVREVAENLGEATEAKIEQRKANAADAKTYRAAQAEGRLLHTLSLRDVFDDDLPRDRLDLESVAVSDEMQELKVSIAARGQREPIEVYVGPDGRYQIKKGWRRHTALSLLFQETGDERYNSVIARIASEDEDHLSRYVDMVEENVIREDLSFAEMAQVAITASQDDRLGGLSPEDLVSKLYSSLHKMKRSYIRSFVVLMMELGDSISWPREISRNLGVDVVRAIKAGGDILSLKRALAQSASSEEQTKSFQEFLSGTKSNAGKSLAKGGREKFEFHVGSSKVTARNGEFRIVSDVDFTQMPRERLIEAIEAFEDALKKG